MKREDIQDEENREDVRELDLAMCFPHLRMVARSEAFGPIR